MEMGLALFLNKKIFLLNPIPDMPSKEEIIGVNPVILDGDLTKISK
jgi:predicted RNA-binding protein with PUA domain